MKSRSVHIADADGSVASDCDLRAIGRPNGRAWTVCRGGRTIRIHANDPLGLANRDSAIRQPGIEVRTALGLIGESANTGTAGTPHADAGHPNPLRVPSAIMN